MDELLAEVELKEDIQTEAYFDLLIKKNIKFKTVIHMGFFSCAGVFSNYPTKEIRNNNNNRSLLCKKFNKELGISLRFHLI